MRSILVVVGFLFAALPAFAKPPLDAFADFPAVRGAAISPDGSKVAYLSRVDDVDYLAIYDFATQTNEPLIRVTEAKARSVFFVSDNYVVLRASETTNNAGRTRRYEDSAAFAYNLTTKSFVQLLRGTSGLYPFQSGLSRIAGIDPDGRHVYMAAYMDRTGGQPTLDLLRVNLDTGRGSRVPGRQGASFTVGWYLDSQGRVVARRDLQESTGRHEIRAYDANGSSRVIFSETSVLPTIQIAGFSETSGRLVVTDLVDSDFYQIFEMSLTDGTLYGPLRTKEGKEIDGTIRDENLIVSGVRYSGLYPSYEFFDAALDADIRAAQSALPDAAVTVSSANRDWSKILLYAHGGEHPPRYMLFDRTQKQLSPVARTRPQLGPDDIGELITIEYSARDGLRIPALVTWPAGLSEDKRSNLPLVVMPHGGPASYDAVGFDWLAQFLANQGYMVLQPNFRGSAGFGAAFMEAGHKEWGRKMQDDVTDGVEAMVKMEWADPERICILGWSYGGYSALIGGAVTPDLYKCVVSIAGVTDLRSMMGTELRNRGPNSSGYTYWKMVIGDPGNASDDLDSISPARLADRFKAPVLLVHGTNDTVVEARQSDRMDEALRRAGKDVTYLRIRGDDHSLVSNESRRQVLNATADFLARHIGSAD